MMTAELSIERLASVAGGGSKADAHGRSPAEGLDTADENCWAIESALAEESRAPGGNPRRVPVRVSGDGFEYRSVALVTKFSFGLIDNGDIENAAFIRLNTGRKQPTEDRVAIRTRPAAPGDGPVCTHKGGDLAVTDDTDVCQRLWLALGARGLGLRHVRQLPPL